MYVTEPIGEDQQFLARRNVARRSMTTNFSLNASCKEQWM